MMLRAAVGRRRYQQAKQAARMKRRVRPLNVELLLKSHRELLDELSPGQLHRLHQQFALYDPDGTGLIMAKHLRPILEALDDVPTDEELDSLTRLVDADANDSLDFQEFLTLIAIRSQPVRSSSEVDVALREFDPSGSGFVSTEELRTALKKLTDVSDAELDVLIHEATDGAPDASLIDIAAFVTKLMSI